MSRKILIFLSCVLMFVLTSCSATAQVDVDAVMTDINSRYQFEDMITLSDVYELEQHFLIDADCIDSFSAQFSSGTSAFTELVFIEAVNKESASEVATTLFNHYQTRLTQAKSYNPEIVNMLESCSVEQHGNYVSLIIDEKAEEIRKVYNSYFE